MIGALRTRGARLVIRASAALVPAPRRERWREEWLGELAAVLERANARAGTAWRFAAGAPRDAWMARRADARRTPAGRWPLAGDIRWSVRALARTPLQSATVFACLLFGTLMTILAFTFVNGALDGDLPGVHDRTRLVTLHAAHRPGERRHSADLHAQEFLGLPTSSAAFSGIAGVRQVGRPIDFGGGARTALGEVVSGNYFDVLGTAPAFGRLLQEHDTEPGAPPVAVISFALWQSEFAGRPDVLGLPLIGARTFQIVGVAPADFAGTEMGKLASDARVSFWTPLDRHATTGDLRTIARLRPGLTTAQAEAISQPLVADLNRAFSTAEVTALRVEPFHMTMLTGAEEMLGFATSVMTLPLIVLLIACANVAGVQLARSLARTHELAVRVSLGASRAAVMRMLVVETFVLAGSATLLALLLAPVLIRWAAPLLPFVPVIDLRVMAFAAVVPLVVTMLTGIFPARRGSGFDVLAGLRVGARAGGHASPGLRRTILIGQLALSTLLIVLAASLVRALDRQPRLAGPPADDVVAATVDLASVLPTPERQQEAVTRTERELRALPGVVNVAVMRWGVFYGSDTSCWADASIAHRETPLRGTGITEPIGQKLQPAQVVTPSYFDIFQVTPVAGRVLTAADRDDTAAVVNQAFVAAHPGVTVGSMIRVKRAPGDDAPSWPVAVVGIVPNSYERSVARSPVPLCYVPLDVRFGQDRPAFIVKSSSPSAVLPALRRILNGIDPRLSIVTSGTVDGLIMRNWRSVRLFAQVLSGFGVVAVVLAAVGLFGAMSHATAQRTREFGVRLALGAHPRTLVALVIQETLLVTCAGAGIGALAATPIVMTYGKKVVPTAHILDAGVVAAVVAVLTIVAFVAAFLPARRVSSVNPVTVLRSE